MIRDENGLLTGYVYIDPGAEDCGRYQERMAAALALARPDAGRIHHRAGAGNTRRWSACAQRLLLIVPLTLAMIVLLIRVNTRSWVKTGIVMLAVPFSTCRRALGSLPARVSHKHGGVGRNDCADGRGCPDRGIHAAISRPGLRKRAGRQPIASSDDLRHVMLEGAAKRIRPKFMTVTTMMIGLLPILWSTGPGADLMKRIAAPMAGGMTSSFLMELLVYPVLYLIWRQRTMDADFCFPAALSGQEDSGSPRQSVAGLGGA